MIINYWKARERVGAVRHLFLPKLTKDKWIFAVCSQMFTLAVGEGRIKWLFFSIRWLIVLLLKKSNRKKKIQIFLGICDRVWFYYSVSKDADEWKVIRGWSGIYDLENIEMFVTFDSVTKGVLFHGCTCHQRYERYFLPPFKSVYFCRNLCRT